MAHRAAPTDPGCSPGKYLSGALVRIDHPSRLVCSGIWCARFLFSTPPRTSGTFLVLRTRKSVHHSIFSALAEPRDLLFIRSMKIIPIHYWYFVEMDLFYCHRGILDG